MAIARKPVPPARPAPVAAPEIVNAPVLAAPEPAPAPEPALAKPPAVVLAVVTDAREQFRKAAETGLEQGRAAYARLKCGAEATAGSLETSFSVAREGLQTINGKTFDVMNKHTQASFEHARALLAAKDVQDLVALQSDFARKQFELFSAHASEFAAQMQKFASDAVAPLKSTIAA